MKSYDVIILGGQVMLTRRRTARVSDGKIAALSAMDYLTSVFSGTDEISRKYPSEN